MTAPSVVAVLARAQRKQGLTAEVRQSGYNTGWEQVVAPLLRKLSPLPQGARCSGVVVREGEGRAESLREARREGDHHHGPVRQGYDPA
jgi:hypothetical protein